VAEIADIYGVPRTTVSMWDARRDSNGFPMPVADLRMGPVYDLQEITDWWEKKQAQQGI